MAALTGRMLCHIPPASLQARQARAIGLNTRRQGSWRTQTRWRRPQTLATAAPVSPPTSPFANVEHEAQLFAILKAGTASGKIPQRLVDGIMELYDNYKKAVVGSGKPGATEDFVAKVMATVCERVLMQVQQPFVFQSTHKLILEPYNYYLFGQRYIRGLVDFDKSRLGHAERFATIQEQLDRGENVVLLANHQTEADPAVFALLLETQFPRLATDVIYVAGDRVVTDPVCVPFSMGRNLFCVHSKKHLDDVPELRADKAAMNRRTLKDMQAALNRGGQLLWIAPSGGRDRTISPENGETVPDAFDPAAVELMRALTTRAKPVGHLYPFAMYSYKVMPPPTSIEKTIGEQRVVNHAGVGISVGPELDVDSLLAAVPADDKAARQAALSSAAFDGVTTEYTALWRAVHAAPEDVAPEYTQPWKAEPARSLVDYL
ncbi:GPAT1 [Auxenochlorella protothecoides x Auxenochlorella symbiontica]